MEVRKEASSRVNGIIVLITLVLAIFSTECTQAEPTPHFSFAINPIERPSPLTPTVTSLPVQQAKANSDFNFNLMPFIHVSQPEFSYQIYNSSRDIKGETTKLMGTNEGIFGVPSGVIHITREPGDCPSSFVLSYTQSCRLRFYVNNNIYTSLQNGHGPVAHMRMSWSWGSKQNRGGGEYTNILPSQTIASILAPIMLPTQINVIPDEQNGLHYDSATSSITGIPTRTGEYHFTISATIGNKTAASQDLKITVNPNYRDTPVFRPHYSLASAMPEHEYRLNLMELIEPAPSFAVSNQVRFRIVQKLSNASWLSLDKDSSTFLHGHPSSSDAGQVKEVTIIATSNTGGDSLPLTIQIPVAFDPEKRPVIDSGIKLSGAAGALFQKDFRANITDPTADGSLKLILDKIEPAAPWLAYSSSNPTQLDGVVPQGDIGQRYQLTLHANTAIGGDSDRVTIPMQIAIDKTKTPQFYSDKPQLPLVYAGQTYFYDFVGCNDVIPGYSDTPYAVELAKGYNNPGWLRIKDNKLIADKVPEHLKQKQQIFITIKNIPGGESKVLTVDLFLMN